MCGLQSKDHLENGIERSKLCEAAQTERSGHDASSLYDFLQCSFSMWQLHFPIFSWPGGDGMNLLSRRVFDKNTEFREERRRARYPTADRSR